MPLKCLHCRTLMNGALMTSCFHTYLSCWLYQVRLAHFSPAPHSLPLPDSCCKAFLQRSLLPTWYRRLRIFWLSTPSQLLCLHDYPQAGLTGSSRDGEVIALHC